VGGRIWIYVWAEDIAGNHSDRATFDFFAPREPPPPEDEATRIALWPLDDDEDDVGAHHLTLSGVQGTDYEWVENWACIPWQALDLRTPLAYAATDSELIDAGESFSITALVSPGAPTGDDQTILSRSGPVTPVVELRQTADDSWRFAVPSVNPLRSGGVAETAPGSLRPDVWSHLAGVVDVPGQAIRLYVNGELAAAAELAAGPWPARGPLYLGVAGSLPGRTAPFQGVLDAVSVWSGSLTDSQIETVTRAGAGFPPCFF
jgi:hypothetical protein